MSRKTYTYKTFKYKYKTYKFKEPLKIVIDNFLGYDLKTMCGELSIPSIFDGYTGAEITKPEKTIREYLTHVFDEYLSKKDEDLSEADKTYKKKWLSMLVR
jgi:hypothetical protein